MLIRVALLLQAKAGRQAGRQAVTERRNGHEGRKLRSTHQLLLVPLLVLVLVLALVLVLLVLLVLVLVLALLLPLRTMLLRLSLGTLFCMLGCCCAGSAVVVGGVGAAAVAGCRVGATHPSHGDVGTRPRAGHAWGDVQATRPLGVGEVQETPQRLVAEEQARGTLGSIAIPVRCGCGWWWLWW
jgi:hypothetical protein